MISCGSPGISPQILQESTPDRKVQYDYEVSQLHHIEHDVFTVFIHGFQSFSPWQGKNCSKQQPMDPLKSSAGVPFTQPVDSRCGRGLLEPSTTRVMGHDVMTYSQRIGQFVAVHL